MPVDETPRTPFPYPGSRNDEMTDRQLGDLARALLLFRVSILIGHDDTRARPRLPISINFDGLTAPIDLGVETAEVLSNGAALMEEISGAIAQLRLQTDNEIRDRQSDARQASADGDRRVREAEARASAASGKAQKALNDERKRRCDAQNVLAAMCNGIEEALAHLEKGRSETRERRCAKALKGLAEEHQIGVVEEMPF